MTVDELARSATSSELKERWRLFALEHHPDRGGSADLFVLGRAAWEKRDAELRAPRKCLSCAGRGRVRVTTGFDTTFLTCEPCAGSGVLLAASEPPKAT